VPFIGRKAYKRWGFDGLVIGTAKDSNEKVRESKKDLKKLCLLIPSAEPVLLDFPSPSTSGVKGQALFQFQADS
jgi:hypothetical protein